MSYSTNTNEKRIGFLCALFLAVLVLPASLYKGWIASIAWGWLIEPTFHVPNPGPIAMSCALLMTGFAVDKVNVRDKPLTADDASMSVILAIIYPALFLFFAWMLSFFAGVSS